MTMRLGVGVLGDNEVSASTPTSSPAKPARVNIAGIERRWWRWNSRSTSAEYVIELSSAVDATTVAHAQSLRRPFQQTPLLPMSIGVRTHFSTDYFCHLHSTLLLGRCGWRCSSTGGRNCHLLSTTTVAAQLQYTVTVGNEIISRYKVDVIVRPRLCTRSVDHRHFNVFIIRYARPNPVSFINSARHLDFKWDSVMATMDEAGGMKPRFCFVWWDRWSVIRVEWVFNDT